MTSDTSASSPSSPPDPATERSKWEAYGETVLEFRGPPRVSVDLRLPLAAPTRRALPALVGGATFAVFTAENPAGENVEDAPSEGEEERREEHNARRRGRLEGELRSLGIAHLPVDGMAPDGDYRERCVAALLPREDAVALARRYGQLALFWFDGDRFWVLPGTAREEPRPLP